MDKLQLLKFIETPSSINKAALPKIVNLIKKYPYCQSMQVLLAKHLYDVKSSHFETQLSKASLYSGDRSYLFDIIHKENAKESNPDTEGKNKSNISVAKDHQESTSASATVKKGLSTSESNAEDGKQLIQKATQRATIKKKEQISTKKVEPVVPEKSDNLGELDADEKKRRLQEQIKQRLAEISNKKTESDSANQEITNREEKKSSIELIDKFMEKDPRIVRKPESEIPEGDLSKESSEDGNFISETLANIYEKQGKYDKALETYEKLILKFPEKSTYFANQIQQIKQKIK